MEFPATLNLDGKTATGIAVPPEIITALDAGKRPQMLLTVNGHAFSTTVGSMKGAFKIPVSAERRSSMNAAAGDSADVSLTLDAAPAEIEVPEDLAHGLASDPDAAHFFAGLTPSQKRASIDPTERAETADTRIRRVEKAAAAVSARQKRPRVLRRTNMEICAVQVFSSGHDQGSMEV